MPFAGWGPSGPAHQPNAIFTNETMRKRLRMRLVGKIPTSPTAGKPLAGFGSTRLAGRRCSCRSGRSRPTTSRRSPKSSAVWGPLVQASRLPRFARCRRHARPGSMSGLSSKSTRVSASRSWFANCVPTVAACLRSVSRADAAMLRPATRRVGKTFRDS